MAATATRIRHLVQRAGQAPFATPARYADRSRGYGYMAHVDWTTPGAVHTGFGTARLEAGGAVDRHVHSHEEAFYVLAGRPVLELDGRVYRLKAHECGLVPVGVPHAWRNDGRDEALWLDVNAPQPRPDDLPTDVFFVPGVPFPEPVDVDIRDPRTRGFFRLGDGQMDVDNLKIGAPVNAPTVSASMATALLAYSGIAVKMLVDERLGATQASMFMVEYQPGGVAQPHDHPLEEAYYILEGEVEFVADGVSYLLRPGDACFTGAGCIHAFYNRAPGRVRWLETQAPLPPREHSYRFDRDWDYLADRLGGAE